MSLGADTFTSTARMRDTLRCIEVLEVTNTRVRRVTVRPPFECTHLVVVLHHIDRRSLEVLKCKRHFDAAPLRTRGRVN